MNDPNPDRRAGDTPAPADDALLGDAPAGNGLSGATPAAAAMAGPHARFHCPHCGRSIDHRAANEHNHRDRCLRAKVAARPDARAALAALARGDL